jgi:rod shape determining protein RodA
MKTETRSEHFQPPTVLGRILHKLHIDIPLFILLSLISLLSFVILYSASNQDLLTLQRQLARVFLAFALMTALAHVNPLQLRRYSAGLFGFGMVLLVAVLVLGRVALGAQRWLDLGFFRFQPSEMMKITTPMMVAWYLAEHPFPLNWKQLAIAAALIFTPTLLIAVQPDLGTAILVSSAGVAVLFFAGLSWQFIGYAALAVAALLPVLWNVMHDYQRARVLTLLNPEADPMGRGYHIIQSKIAIGSGGLSGKGWLGSTQAKLDYLPESSTDFIFAVFAEEFGLAGCLGLLVLYFLVICRCLVITLEAKDPYSRLLAGSLSFAFFVYVFVNVGMVIGILPVVGVPLPLISYGGTSMVTLMASFGILMSIHTHKKLLPH